MASSCPRSATRSTTPTASCASSSTGSCSCRERRCTGFPPIADGLRPARAALRLSPTPSRLRERRTATKAEARARHLQHPLPRTLPGTRQGAGARDGAGAASRARGGPQGDRRSCATVLAQPRRPSIRGIGVDGHSSRTDVEGELGLAGGLARARASFWPTSFRACSTRSRRRPIPTPRCAGLERITAQVGARATLYQRHERRPVGSCTCSSTSRGTASSLTNILANRPGTLDQLMDALSSGRERGLDSFDDIPTATVPTGPRSRRASSPTTRTWRLLRIGLRDVRGEGGPCRG